jgi:GNAT superfamily N-acetyltransferase
MLPVPSAAAAGHFVIFSQVLRDFLRRTIQFFRQGLIAKGWRASSASMEIDVASFDPHAFRQISGETATLLRTPPRIPHIVRTLGAEDERAFRALLLGLDDACRLSRFCGITSDEGIARHTRQALSETAWLAGLFVDDELCGVVELYEASDPGDLEAAFAVASRWRRLGFGTALLFAALEWARHSRRATLHMIFSRTNWPMRRLASKAEPTFDLTLDELIASVVIGGGAGQPCRAGGNTISK